MRSLFYYTDEASLDRALKKEAEKSLEKQFRASKRMEIRLWKKAFAKGKKKCIIKK